MKEATNWLRLLELAINGGALLVHLSVKATFLLGITLAVVRVLRRCSAALRHTLWLVAGLALLLLPVLSLGLPAWHPVIADAGGSMPASSSQFTTGRETTSLLLHSIVSGRGDFVPSLSPAQCTLPTLFVVWVLGALVTARKLATGFVAVNRLQRRGRLVVEGPLWDEFTQCSRSLGIDVSRTRSAPRLVVVADEELTVPLTWGL